jgi:hypothetical protein
MVLSTATQLGSTVVINASGGGVLNGHQQVRPILLQADQSEHTRLDVFDTGHLLGRFAISSVRNVQLSVAGADVITVDDSNDFPFAPGTTISLFGSGNNSLTLTGSQPVGNPPDLTPGRSVSNSLGLAVIQPIDFKEVYTAGTASRAGSLSLGGALFQFSSAIRSVSDDVQTGTLVVNAPGQSVSAFDLNNQGGVTEELVGLAGDGGGGGTLTFRNKRDVSLEMQSAGASAFLGDTAAASGLRFFNIDLLGQNQTLDINATPSNVRTVVSARGLFDQVNLGANSGRVDINGNGVAGVTLGSNDIDFSKSVTSGIRQHVFVSGASRFRVEDGGNVRSRERMTVTDSTISGTGMFGNDSVAVHYSSSAPLIDTGRLANTYTVAGAHFLAISNQFSNAGMSVLVTVDPGSHLSLSLFNKNAAAGSLLISAQGATFNPLAPTTPDGTETVTFAGGVTSKVAYRGFRSVVHS